MAPVFKVMRTCGLIFSFVLSVLATQDNSTAPWISSVEILAKNCDQNNCKYLLNVRGSEFLGYRSWRLTSNSAAKGVICDKIYPEYELKEVETTQWISKLEVTVPLIEGKIYYCLYHNKDNTSPFGGEWVHQGPEWFLDAKHDNISQKITSDFA
jgi:hypothetical protein